MPEPKVEPAAELEPAPAPAPTIPRSFDVFALGRNTCFVREDGRVVCAGKESENNYGDLVPFVELGATRIVSGLHEIVQIATHRDRRCVVTLAGQVSCFGPIQSPTNYPYVTPPANARAFYLDNKAPLTIDDEGRMFWYPSAGSDRPRQWQPVLGPDGPLEHIAEMVVHDSKVWARAETGELWTFFYEDEPAAERLDLGASILDLCGSPWPSVTALDADGFAHSLTGGGGPEQFGAVTQLVDGCGLRPGQPPICRGGELSGAPPARALVADRDQTCVVAEADGGVYCQRGDQKRFNRVAHLSPAKELVSLDSWVCSLTEAGELRCVNGRGSRRSTPALHGDRIGAAGGELCVIDGGRPECWRPLDDWHDELRWSPPLDDAVGIESLGRREQLCLRRADGSALCGHDREFGRYLELRAGPIAGLSEVAEVAVGESFACARERTGTVKCWGLHGEQGQLGDGRERSTLTPVAVAGLDDAVDIDAGPHTACAARASGEVVCWGRMPEAAEHQYTQRHASAPERILGLTGAVQIVVDSSASPSLCARHADGGVSCTAGWFGFGRHNYMPPTESARVPELERAIHIVAGANAFCALTGAAEQPEGVTCWGNGMLAWDAERGPDRARFDFAIDGLRSVGLSEWSQLCVEASDTRGPNCWSLPEFSTSSAGPGELYPFADPDEPAQPPI